VFGITFDKMNFEECRNEQDLNCRNGAFHWLERIYLFSSIMITATRVVVIIILLSMF